MNLEQQTLTSIEVSEMVNKDHKELLRDIRRYSDQLGESKIALTDFFAESTYQSEQNKTLPCYLVTKKGCEFIAHKLTGIKGTEFTAKYINKFHDMEEVVQENILDGISPELQAIIFQDKKLQLIVTHMEKSDRKITEVNQDLQNFKLDMPLLGLETDKITSAVRTKGVNCLGGKNSNAYQNKSLRGKIYSDIYSQLKREFDVYSYKAIKRSQADLAVDIVQNYKLPFILQQQVEDENTQINMEV